MHPGQERPVDEPAAPLDYQDGDLPFGVRAELRSLPADTAKAVGGHILAASELVDDEPELALKHARAARRKAGRLPVAREIAAEVAYAAGDYESALSDYRALVRMNGNPNFLPVIADCERALGKYQTALRTLRQAHDADLDVVQETETILVEAGLRADMGQPSEALRLLKTAIVNKQGGRAEQARLRYAYARQLAAGGQVAAAKEWFSSADRYDDEQVLGAKDEVAALEGKNLTEDDGEFDILAIDEYPTDADEDGDILPQHGPYDEDDTQ